MLKRLQLFSFRLSAKIAMQRAIYCKKWIDAGQTANDRALRDRIARPMVLNRVASAIAYDDMARELAREIYG